MNEFLKLSIQSLNFIFSQMADSKSKVLWITNPTYNKQLFISPNFEKIWGKPCHKLYEDPSSWHDSLTYPHVNHVVNQLKSRNERNNVTFYCIRNANAEINYIRDTCFYIFDNIGQQIAVGGVAQVINQMQWEDEYNMNLHKNGEEKYLNNDFSAMMKNHFNLILNNSSKPKLNPETKDISGFCKDAKLTHRELECLNHLCNGKSTKMIARFLMIAPRTAETHIENIKKKLKCRSRIELISKLHEITIKSQ